MRAWQTLRTVSEYSLFNVTWRIFLSSWFRIDGIMYTDSHIKNLAFTIQIFKRLSLRNMLQISLSHLCRSNTIVTVMKANAIDLVGIKTIWNFASLLLDTVYLGSTLKNLRKHVFAFPFLRRPFSFFFHKWHKAGLEAQLVA